MVETEPDYKALEAEYERLMADTVELKYDLSMQSKKEDKLQSKVDTLNETLKQIMTAASSE